MVLSIFLWLVLPLFATCSSHKDGKWQLQETSPESHPYVAAVKGNDLCNGVLVSPEYVLTPASCVCRSPKVGVLLGMNKYPYYPENRQDPKGQIFAATEIILHDDYAKIHHQRHLNNIALIKLPHAVNLSENVHPAKLITKEDVAFLDGTVANIVGWRQSSNTNLKLADVRLRNQDTCKFMFGGHYFGKQEFCVQWLCQDSLNLMGNPISYHGRVFGFQTAALPCLWDEYDCSQNDLILNFAPYLDWINLHVFGNIQATGLLNEKVASLLHLVDELKSKQAADRALLDETFDSVSKSIEAGRKKGSELELRLNEELSDLKTEITNSETKHNASIYQLQEDFSNSKQEFSDGLNAQKTSSDNIAKRVDDLDIRLPQLDESLKLLETQSEKTRESFHALTAELQEEIKKVKRQVEELQGEFPCPHCVGELREEVFNHLKQVTTKVELQFGEIDKDLHHLHDELQEVQSQENLVTKTLWPRVDFIEKVVDETRSRLDRQIILELQHTQQAAHDKEVLTDTLNGCCRRYNGLYGPP